jgi:nucleotide-binding universal stress UspA family protein
MPLTLAGTSRKSLAASCSAVAGWREPAPQAPQATNESSLRATRSNAFARDPACVRLVRPVHKPLQPDLDTRIHQGLAMPTFHHILFPFDSSPPGVQAVPFVKALATRFDAKVTILTVAPPAWDVVPFGAGALVEEATAESARALTSQLDQALLSEFTGLSVDYVTDAGDPARRITDFAPPHGVDLIMMPTHGVGLFRRLLLGSVAAKVLHDATCPVWTATHAEEERARPLPRTVLCAVDKGPAAPGLMQWAAAFTARIGATLSLLHVVEPITDWPSLEREQARQDQFRAEAREKMESLKQAAGVAAPLRVAVGEIVATVTEDARQEDADLVLIGRGSIGESHGRWRTHAQGISRRSPCPVLSV